MKDIIELRAGKKCIATRVVIGLEATRDAEFFKSRVINMVY